MLIRNIFILSLVHIVRLVLPLLLIPVLTSRIAADDFGVYMYAMSFSVWLAVFIEYGFNISSTREIASARKEEDIISVVAGTQSAKLMLIVATVPLLFLATLLVPVFSGHLYWATVAWLLGVLTALSPIYYFQGRENLKIVGYAEILSGGVLLAAVYLFIHSSDDFYLLAAIALGTRLLSLLILSWRMYRGKRVGPRELFNFRHGIEKLRTGFNIFVFQAAVSLYTSFNVVFLGFFCSPVQVGVYASAERLMRAGIGFIAQFSNAIFPRLNALNAEDPLKMERLRIKVLLGFALIGVLGTLLTLGIAPIVVQYMFSDQADGVLKILNILAFIVPGVAMANVLGFHYLLVDRHEKIFSVIIAFAALVNVILAYVLIQYYQVVGMAVSWIAVEWLIAIVTGLAVVILSRKKSG